MRADPGAARLGPPERAHDPPRADPPPGQQARGADRHALHQPGRARRHRRRPGERRPRRGRRLRRRALRHRQLGSARHQRQHPGALLPQPAQRIALLGRRLDPDHQRRLRALLAQDRRPGAALRRGQRLASAPHLDRRHRPRPRPPARPDGRGEAHLRRPLLRHLARPDLRQPVPRPHPSDAAQRHRRRNQGLEGGRGEDRQRRQLGRPGLRPVPRPLRRRRTGALRARRWPPHRGRALPATGRAGKARADPGPRGEAAALVAPGAQLRRYAALTVPAAQGSTGCGRQTRRISMPRCAATDRRSRAGRAASPRPAAGRGRRPPRRSPAPTRPPTGNYGPGRR